MALDDFAIDIKLYRDDLEREIGCRYQTTDAAWLPTDSEAPTLRIGDAVGLRTREFDESRRRFLFDRIAVDDG